MARFGFEVTRNSPRQADVLVVMGTITYRTAPVMKRLYDQMAEPKYVVAVGGCTISGGPFIKSYNVVNGIDKVIPVDVYIPKMKVERYLGGVNRSHAHDEGTENETEKAKGGEQ